MTKSSPKSMEFYKHDSSIDFHYTHIDLANL